MEIRMTTIADAEADLLVRAGTGTTFGSLRPLLPSGGADGARWYVGEEPLADDAVLGRGLLVDGAVLQAQPGGAAVPRPRTGLLEARLVSGPDAGRVVRLLPGRHVLGRGPASDVRIDDPRVSRLHAAVVVGAGGCSVQDTGSSNGTTAQGRTVGRAPTPLPLGSRLALGASTVALIAPDCPPAPLREDGAGGRELNRPPRLLPVSPLATFRMPPRPQTREPARVPVAALVLPLILGAVLVPLLGDWRFALFLLLSPLLLLGNVVGDRRAGRRGDRRAHEAWADAVEAVRDRVAAAVRDDLARRNRHHPDAADLVRRAQVPLPDLWERRPTDEDFLSLRLGTGDLPSDVELRTSEGLSDEEPPPVLSGAPLTVDLRRFGVLGVAGSDRADAVVRHLLLQLVTLHSPRDVQLVVLSLDADAARRWRWARWLPHVAPADGQRALALLGCCPESAAERVAELVARLERLRPSPLGVAAPGGDGRTVVVVYDGIRELRRWPDVGRLLREGPAAGIVAVCVGGSPLDLPVECGATATLTGPNELHLTLRADGSDAVVDAVADGVATDVAAGVARALAPLRDATPSDASRDLPGEVRLLELLPFDGTDPAQVLERWAAGGPAQSVGPVVLGCSQDGPWSVDVTKDGPHALVAGTTGSGKSELLQTLVASLALHHSTEAVVFVLVDYKGGSAFAACARLPHTVGLVTDLDGPLTERALVSLAAELQRRERLLAEHGCADIRGYQRLRAGASDLSPPPLPRLLLVVDEFATLVEELPDFVGGLVGIAQRGRSLGLHLVLATQRPGGVVSADIRANTDLRVALRVGDAGESMDVLDVRDAAAISRDTPGRACVRLAGGDRGTVQTARVAAPRRTTEGPAVHAVRCSDRAWMLGELPWPATPESHLGEARSDLDAIVESITSASRLGGYGAPAAPWLPPLPEVLTLAELDEPEPSARRGGEGHGGAGSHGDDSAPSWRVPMGLADRPAHQRQDVYALDLARDEHLLVAGGPRSGRSSALRAVAAGVAVRFHPRDVHVHVLDCGNGSLAPLEGLPHAGTVVGRSETDRGERLLRRLVEEVERRQQLLAAGGFASVLEHRQAVPSQERLPWIVLLVDSWDGFLASYDDLDHGRVTDTLLRLVREGGAAGVRVVVSGDRSVLTGRLGSLVADRVLLRFADPADYAMAGVPARLAPRDPAPGRGLLPATGTQVQLALLDADPSGPAQAAALDRLATATRPTTPGALPPLRLARLPDRCSASELMAVTGGAHPDPGGTTMSVAGGDLWTPLGLGGDDLAVTGVDLAAAPYFLLAGPGRSGRSTTLATMAGWLLRRGVQVVVVTCRPASPVGTIGSVGTAQQPLHLPADRPELLHDRLASSTQPLVVLADDAEQLAGSPVEQALLEATRAPGRGPQAVVVAAEASYAASAYRGLVLQARRGRAGLLLQPGGGAEADLLGTRVPRCTRPRPGRGVLVLDGSLTDVQVAVWDAPEALAAGPALTS